MMIRWVMKYIVNNELEIICVYGKRRNRNESDQQRNNITQINIRQQFLAALHQN